jgi:enolase
MPLPLPLEDADKLDDTYNLDVLIKYTRCSHITYDMHDVFLIVYPKDGTQANVVDYTKDLYTEYPDISIEDVARSNEWYRNGWLRAGLPRISNSPTLSSLKTSLMTCG